MGFQTGFSKNLGDIVNDVGSLLHKQSYSLKNIVPVYNYNSSTQVNTLGANEVTESGGVLSLSLKFDFEAVDGRKKTSGTGIATFQNSFVITLIKNATFTPAAGL